MDNIRRDKYIEHLVPLVVDPQETLVHGIFGHRMQLVFLCLLGTERIVDAITRQLFPRIVHRQHLRSGRLISSGYQGRIRRANHRKKHRTAVFSQSFFLFPAHFETVYVVKRTENFLVLQVMQIVKSDMTFPIVGRNIKYAVVERLQRRYNIVFVRPSP